MTLSQDLLVRGLGPSAVLSLLGDAPASPASRGLASDRIGPAKRPTALVPSATNIAEKGGLA